MLGDWLRLNGDTHLPLKTQEHEAFKVDFRGASQTRIICSCLHCDLLVLFDCKCGLQYDIGAIHE